jgi:hypothetical protein
MEKAFQKTGGAQIGWVNASWPLAQITSSHDTFSIRARMLGTYSFTPDQVTSIERYVLFSLIASGIRVRHLVPGYPQRIIFWSLSDPEILLNGIRDSGFVPAGSISTTPLRRGIPIRWSAIVVGVILWNVIFMLPFAAHNSTAPAPDWLAIVPLFVMVGLFISVLRSLKLQRLILKPGRSVGEIRPFLNLIIFILGLLSVIFTILVLTGAFNHTHAKPL